MDDQERSREALIDHIAEQDRIIRRRNEQIAQQAENSREAQNAIEDIEEELARYRAMHSKQVKTIARLQKAERSRPLAADDITDEMVERALAVERRVYDGYTTEPVTMRELLTAALTEPTRPEEKVEAVLNQYWSGDVDGTDLAALIVEEMNR